MTSLRRRNVDGVLISLLNGHGFSAALAGYAWPGNVCGLRNTIERVAILTPGERLTVESVPVEIRLSRDAGARSSLQEARDAAERKHLVRALEQSNWNVTVATRLVGMERTNLHKRIRALGLSRGGNP